MQQTDTASGTLVMPCPIYSFAARLRQQHGEQSVARVTQSDESRDAWIIALHLAACRRWLAKVPPSFDLAEQTLQLVHGATAPGAGGGDAFTGATTLAIECGDDPDARLRALRRHVDDLERDLHAWLPNSPS